MTAAATSALRWNSAADAYLEWALHTKFSGFHVQQNKRVALLVERLPSPSNENLTDWETELKNNNVHMTMCYQNMLFATVLMDVDFLLSSEGQAFCIRHFKRMELASALTQPANTVIHWLEKKETRTWNPKAKTIVACIDDAFPLASTRFFHAQRSRVLRLWDQGQKNSAWYALGDPQTGMPKANFSYGSEVFNPGHLKVALAAVAATNGKIRQWWRNILNVFLPTQAQASTSKMALPTWADTKEDMAYYERWGMQQLRRHHTHGGHVLDTLVGPISVLDRIERPSCPAPAKAVSDADLVLVQLPQSAINDPSGRWLGHHVLDGLHYILQASGEAEKIVTNISWGPQTGPHDGSSLLELAMDDMLQNDQRLSITLPAGNSFQARAHAQWTLDQSHKGHTLKWCVPPGLKHLSFLEIWSDKPDPFTVNLTSPAGETNTINGLGIQSLPGCGLVQINHASKRAMVLVVLHPTCSDDATPTTSRHGQWQVEVFQPNKNAQPTQFHAYVARSNSNMGGVLQQRDAYLLDAQYEELRRKPPHQQSQPLTGDAVTQQGTLNGIGTGQHYRLYVTAGYRLSDGEPAPYSSSRPVVGSGAARPDSVRPSDESVGLPGLRAGATRAGAVVRLVGTSTAAPQMARYLAR